jgi:agmatinase
MPRVEIVGFPTDEHSSFIRGAAEGPARIRRALRSPAGNLCAEDGRDLALHVTDGGDPEGSIEESVRTLLARGVLPLALGGDHSISFPIVSAVAERHDPLDLIQFDAHPDLYDEYDGDRLSHACPFARIMESGSVRRLIQVGIRTMNEPQREQASRFGVEVIEMRAWDDGFRPSLDGPVYVSVDLDVLDPAFAPGVAHREPGGVSTRQLIETIQRLDGELVGADVVELNPREDPHGLTAGVAAKLVKELASRMLRGG